MVGRVLVWLVLRVREWLRVVAQRLPCHVQL